MVGVPLQNEDILTSNSELSKWL